MRSVELWLLIWRDCNSDSRSAARMHAAGQWGSALGDGAQVHEVAVAAARAGVLLVLPAGGLPEVRNRAELHQDGPPRVKAPAQALQRARRRVLVPAHSSREDCI